MITKGCFGISRNTNGLVGIADDAFEDSVVSNELKMLENNVDKNVEKEMNFPGTG
jgi:hypothetical protein